MNLFWLRFRMLSFQLSPHHDAPFLPDHDWRDSEHTGGTSETTVLRRSPDCDDEKYMCKSHFISKTYFLNMRMKWNNIISEVAFTPHNRNFLIEFCNIREVNFTYQHQITFIWYVHNCITWKRNFKIYNDAVKWWLKIKAFRNIKFLLNVCVSK